jgi:hypothetical protein
MLPRAQDFHELAREVIEGLAKDGLIIDSGRKDGAPAPAGTRSSGLAKYAIKFR